MIAEPEFKTDQIIGKLNQMAQSGAIDEFQLAGFKREAENIKKDDIANGFLLLGMIACLENKPDEMRSNHENSLHYSGRSLFFLGQYIQSLRKINDFHTAYKIAKEAAGKKDAHQVDVELYALILIDYADICLELDYEDELHGIMDDYKKLTGKDIPLDFPEDDPEHLEKTLNLAEQLLEDKSKLVKLTPALFNDMTALLKKTDPELYKEIVEGFDSAEFK